MPRVAIRGGTLALYGLGPPSADDCERESLVRTENDFYVYVHFQFVVAYVNSVVANPTWAFVAS